MYITSLNAGMLSASASASKNHAKISNVLNKNTEPQKTETSVYQNSLSGKVLASLYPVNFKGIGSGNVVSGEGTNVSIAISNVDLAKYSLHATEAVRDINPRIGKEGQFLNWIGILPKNQLQEVDNLYNLADKASENGKYTDLVILGIGGSRHTTENMVTLLGKNRNVHFYSGIDQDSFDRLTSKLDPNKTKFVVASKSGGTLETTTAYENSKKYMQEKLGREDVSDKFIAMTDVSSEKSKLRKLVDAGDLKWSALVHDDVGGRFSIFDDATIFTLAYAGVPKKDVINMLNASLLAQKEFLNPDIKQNPALQLAAFNVQSAASGKKNHFIEYFGDAFSAATLWEKQLKNESLKAAISTDTNVGPAYLHYNAEADLHKDNNDSFFSFVFVKPKGKVPTAVIEGVTNAYANQHPVSQIILKDLSVESIAKYLELKHFETLYTGNILRRTKGDITPQNEQLPEILQPNVEIYKEEVRAAMAK